MNQSKFRERRVSNIRPLGSALIGPIRREQAGVYRNRVMDKWVHIYDTNIGICALFYSLIKEYFL